MPPCAHSCTRTQKIQKKTRLLDKREKMKWSMQRKRYSTHSQLTFSRSFARQKTTKDLLILIYERLPFGSFVWNFPDRYLIDWVNRGWRMLERIHVMSFIIMKWQRLEATVEQQTTLHRSLANRRQEAGLTLLPFERQTSMTLEKEKWNRLVYS